MIWFKDRSSREKWMIVVMVFLLASFAIFQFALKPTFDAHKSAVDRHKKAEKNLQTLTFSAAKLSPSSASVDLKSFNRAELVRLSDVYNLPISRVQPQNNGSVQVWYDTASGQNIFRLIEALETEYSAKITGLQISKRGESSLAVQLQISSPKP